MINKRKATFAALIVLSIIVICMASAQVAEFFRNTNVYQLECQPGIKYELYRYGKDIVLINNEEMQCINSSGKTEWRAIETNTVPSVDISGRYILVADLKGKTASLYENGKKICSIRTPNIILSAKVNSKGNFAIATKETGYKGCIVIYNKAGKQTYKWHSGEGYIGGMDISSSGNIAVAQIMTDKEEANTRLSVVKPKSNKVKRLDEIKNSIPATLRFNNDNSLVVVTDTGFSGYSRFGTKKYNVSFGSRAVENFNIENESNMIFAFMGSVNTTKIESYSKSGKHRGTYNAKNQIKYIDACGEIITGSYMRNIEYIKPKGLLKRTAQVSHDIRQMKMFSDKKHMLVIGGSSADVVKIR